MSDIKLFRINATTVQELQGTSIAIEKTLQVLIETHLEVFLGVRFLATGLSTGKTHGGRIDTLGIDENGSPVIIEYKRAINENIINQGLFYLDWLMDHKGEFELLVLKTFGKDAGDSIDWSAPRLLCIASDFTKYDEYAVQQINRNIELIRYRRYGNDLVLFELVNATTATAQTPSEPVKAVAVQTQSERINTPAAQSQTAQFQTKAIANGNHVKNTGMAVYKTATELFELSPPDLRDRFEAINAFLLALGDDVQMKVLKNYFAFRRIKNFACVEIHPQSQRILLFVKVDPSTLQSENGFPHDVRNIGHYGTSELEITIRNNDDFERAKPYVLKSYEVS